MKLDKVLSLTGMSKLKELVEGCLQKGRVRLEMLCKRHWHRTRGCGLW